MMSDIPTTHTDTNPLELAVFVSRQVQIHSISIVETRASRAEDEQIARGGFSIKNEFANLGAEIRDNNISARIGFVLRTTRDGEVETDPVILIEAQFLLVYSVPSTEGIEDRNLSAFVEINGVYNAWPYWREYVQNVSVRMGLPPITVPVYRIPEPSKVTTTASESGSPTPGAPEGPASKS
jgi:hypothetical protein